MQWMDWQTRKKSVIILNLCWNIQQLSLKELRKLSHPEQEMLTRWVSGNGPTDAPTDGCTWPPLYVKFIIRYMFIISITSTIDIWNCNHFFFLFKSPEPGASPLAGTSKGFELEFGAKPVRKKGEKKKKGSGVPSFPLPSRDCSVEFVPAAKRFGFILYYLFS